MKVSAWHIQHVVEDVIEYNIIDTYLGSAIGQDKVDRVLYVMGDCLCEYLVTRWRYIGLDG